MKSNFKQAQNFVFKFQFFLKNDTRTYYLDSYRAEFEEKIWSYVTYTNINEICRVKIICSVFGHFYFSQVTYIILYLTFNFLCTYPHTMSTFFDTMSTCINYGVFVFSIFTSHGGLCFSKFAHACLCLSLIYLTHHWLNYTPSVSKYKMF
jgi:hypothetical protein